MCSSLDQLLDYGQLLPCHGTRYGMQGNVWDCIEFAMGYLGEESKVRKREGVRPSG